MTKLEINKKDENGEIEKWKIRYEELAEANRHVLQRESMEIKKLQSEVSRLMECLNEIFNTVGAATQSVVPDKSRLAFLYAIRETVRAAINTPKKKESDDKPRKS